MKHLLISIIFLFLYNYTVAQKNIILKGKILDESGVEIPYAGIINITTYKHGTTSKKDGTFTLKTHENQSHIIQISALGFYEKKIKVSEILHNGIIKLKTKSYDLGATYVEGTRYEKGFIGKSKVSTKSKNTPPLGYTISSVPGLQYGVYVIPSKKKSGLIDKIHFYLTNQGFPEAPIKISLFKTQKKLKNNKIYNLDEFTPMTDTILIHKEGKPGWNTINLYNADISFDNESFFITFSTLDNGKKYEFLGTDGEKEYGACLGVFQNLKPDEIYRAINIDGGLGYSNIKSSRIPIPAVYIEYSKTK